MSLAERARDYLPATVQDMLRSAADRTIPSRRTPVRQDEVVATLLSQVSPEGLVLAGPFRGMRLSLEASWGGMAARLAGTYEMELESSVDSLIRTCPPVVVDIGAAEGYYAVGMALRLPASRVVAFEIDPKGRRACALNARLNAVKNLEIKGRATRSRLRRDLHPRSLVLSDCEGFEFDLLDPVTVPVLSTCRLLVELHEFARQGLTAAMVERFGTTHRIDIIDAVPRDVVDADHLTHLDAIDLRRVVEEGRPLNPPMQWAVMTPRETLSTQ